MPTTRAKHLVPSFSAILLFVTFLMIGANSANAAPVVFENDQPGWEAAASANAQLTVIDFDSVPSNTLLLGNEFSSLPANPMFSSVFAFDGSGPYVASSGAALSGPNILRPTNSARFNDGVVRVVFDTPIFSMAASFFDVEGDFAATGFGLGSQTTTPDIAFSSPLSNSYLFLGFVSDVPISTVDIYFAAFPNNQLGIDGTFLDDLQYAVVPEPSAAFFVAIGLAGLVIKRSQRGFIATLLNASRFVVNFCHKSRSA